MKLITTINEEISIYADGNQYVVKVKLSPKQRFDKQATWYFPSLEMCFQEIFDYLCKKRLADGGAKALKQVAETILATKREILEVVKPFVRLRP